MVAVTPGEDIKEMCRKLEQQELSSQLSGGRTGSEVYSELLAGYIALGRLPEAKFLWKRIPDNVKQECPELGKIWEIGKSIWKRDYPNVFQNLQTDWSDSIKPLMLFITQQYREDTLRLLSNAYSTIKMSDLAQYLGQSPSEAGQRVQSLGWKWNKETDMVEPVRCQTESYKRESLNNQLQRVADFISYLEN